MAVTLDTHELAWAAGFFDGEGWCSTKSSRDGKGLSMGVVQCKDHEVIDRFQNAVLGIGRQYAGTRNRLVWNSQRFEFIQAAVALLWKWMSPVSKRKVANAFATVRANGGYQTRPGWCPKGHQLAGDNLYVRPNGKSRACRTCRTEYNRCYYELHPRKAVA